MIQPPDTLITYRIKDASVFWHICDDSINVYDTSCEDGICIHGVDANAVFQMARNVMCCAKPCFEELSHRPHQLEQAKEMRNALTAYIESREAKEESNDSN